MILPFLFIQHLILTFVYLYIYTVVPVKSLDTLLFVMFLKEVAYDHQVCIESTIILWFFFNVTVFYIYNYGVKTVSNPPTNARDRSTGRFTNACERSTSKHTIQTCMREIHTWQYKQVHYCYFAHRMILKYCIYTPYFMQQITSPLNECSAWECLP